MLPLKQRLKAILTTIEPNKVTSSNDSFIDCRSTKTSPYEHATSSDTTSSHNYPPELLELIDQRTEEWVLDCGSGSRNQKFPNVVNFDILPYNGVDVVGLAEELPFKSNSFDLVISLAVLEHVKSPAKAAQEMQRILKKGGLLWIDVAFMQPFHGYPAHYYNMTQVGLEHLLQKDMKILRDRVPRYGTPIWSITWIISKYANSLPEKAREQFLRLPISELLKSPDSLSEEPFVSLLPEAARKEMAATVSILAQKSMQTPATTSEKRNFEGHLDHTESGKIFGWVSDKDAPHERFSVKLKLSNGWSKTILANELREDLKNEGIGDGQYGFSTTVPYEIANQTDITVCASVFDHTYDLDKSGRELKPEHPIAFIAGDITNNCNLRCPFCITDYSKTGRLKAMTPQVFKNLIPILPLVPDGMFWLSCMHEATIHPQFVELLKSIPFNLRKKGSFTTNLCKTLDDETLRIIAESNFHNIRISLDSLDPKRFSELRKGGRLETFLDNLNRLAVFLKSSEHPPAIRFISMVFANNASEMKGVIKYCKELIPDCAHEVRFLFYQPHIADWGKENILSLKSWKDLKSSLEHEDGFAHTEFYDPLPNTHKDFENKEGSDTYEPYTAVFGGNCTPSEHTRSDPLENNSSIPNEALRLRLRWDGLLVHELMPEKDFLQFSQNLNPEYFINLRISSQKGELNNWTNSSNNE